MTDDIKKEQCDTCLAYRVSDGRHYCYDFEEMEYDEIFNADGCEEHMAMEDLEKVMEEVVNKRVKEKTMSNGVQLFQFETNDVRVMVDDDGSPWWVAKDVCDVLGLDNVTRALETVTKDNITKTHVTDSVGRQRITTIISEPALYHLIFKSRKSEARRFQKWVTSEVLPAIRKTGTYNVSADDPFAVMKNMVNASAMIIKQMERQEKKIERLEERVNTFDSLDIMPNDRQKLNSMLKRYAYEAGIAYSKAWTEFVRHFNTTYNTNINLKKSVYCENHNTKATLPQYLETVNLIMDGIRVLEKMLNLTGKRKDNNENTGS